MKKTIFIFLLIINFYDVYASTQTDTSHYIEVKQEVISYTDNSIDIQITIPYEYNDKYITINYNILDAINHFRLLNKSNRKVKVNLIIINNSNNIYSYKKDSLMIYQSYIHSNYLYRTKNTAIKALFKNEKIFLDDMTISRKLQSIGYKDISELDKYYLDFYNKKYKVKYKEIKKFNNKIKKEIFKKTNSNTLETNKNIIDLSYNYYYSKLLKIKTNNITYSLEDCVKYYINDGEFKYYLSNITNNKVSFYVLLDEDYNDLFKNYLSGNIKFILEKEISY